MGSVFRVPVFYVDAKDYLSSYRERNPENPIIGAAMDGVELNKADLPTNGLLVLGSESHGIDENVNELISQFVTIPKMGEAESLNVAVATGIVLWEWNRG
jgi:TrmH family RNA methyltransferase